MALVERQEIMRRIVAARGGRLLVTLFNFDRPTSPPIDGLAMQFNAESKEALFRVLKESDTASGVDLCLYTRGGDTNAVWPIVNLLREFDRDFEVLIPFRAHSAGTMVSMGAKHIWMTAIAELSPIDPTTGNQFNPSNPANPEQRLGISVEDVLAYVAFVSRYTDTRSAQTGNDGDLVVEAADDRPVPQHFLGRLTTELHPLALGNVYRVHRQIGQLAKKLLGFHPRDDRSVEDVVHHFTTRFYSHLHMIDRHEARGVLGGDHLRFAEAELALLLDELLRSYEDTFALRERFLLAAKMGDEQTKETRFIGGAIETVDWSYHFETVANVSQSSKIPPNVTVQVPAGQRVPLIPGLPRQYHIEIQRQGWARNREPRGVTI